MSNTEELKNYLLEKENAFLLDENNNGKTIMLSGAWGAGKTHFWQNEIEPELSKELKGNDKACIYVSLYGKDSLDTLKKEILIKASSENNLISKEVSTFGMDTLASIKDSDLQIGKVVKAVSGLNSYRKSNKGKNRLKDGGIVCFDDFERKSKDIDLNDLFGFISQLAIEMNCKIVIILNSDVFTGKEAEVFRNVKEKTVNKFLYFEPSIEELFKSIAKDIKYNTLSENNKSDILKTIKRTEELNARIYIQVLDNCLEWMTVKKNLDDNMIVQVLTLGTFNFVLNHMVLDYMHPNRDGRFPQQYKYYYKEINFSIRLINESFKNIDNTRYGKELLKSTSVPSNIKEEEFLEFLIYKDINREYLEKNKKRIKALWKYGYRLYYVGNVDEKTYKEIAKFIKSGILI